MKDRKTGKSTLKQFYHHFKIPGSVLIVLTFYAGLQVTGCSFFKKKEPYIFPFSSARIGVLSKYHLKDFEVEGKNVRLMADNGEYVFKEMNLRLKIAGDGISVFEKAGLSFITKSVVVVPVPGAAEKTNATRALLVRWAEHKRLYAGKLEARARNGEFLIVNTVDVEDYIYQSARQESGDLLKNNLSPDTLDTKVAKEIKEVKKAKEEFLRATETVIRSYLFYHRDRHKDEGYDLCDLTHCLVYGGGIPGGQNNNENKYVLLGQNGNPLNAYFHSTCGGNLSSPGVYWPVAENQGAFRNGFDGGPGAVFNKSQYCQKSPHSDWQARVEEHTLAKIFGERFNNLGLVYKDNRVSSLTYLGDAREKKQMGIALFLSKIGRELGWSVIKSNDFSVTHNGNAWFFQGRGLGHGIGLCQWGAMEQARQGKTFKEILGFYYPGAEIRQGVYP